MPKKPELPEAVLAFFRRHGATGGKTRAKNMTKAKRKASASAAAKARWAKYRAEN